MAKQDRTECNEFAARIQDLAALKLWGLGFKIKQNDVNDGSNGFDILAEKPGLKLKLEVKAARLHDTGRRGMRYHARIHNGEAEYLLLYCETEPPDFGGLEGAGSWFIIPMIEIWPRPNITIWSPDPTKSKGQWRPYLENWEILQ